VLAVALQTTLNRYFVGRFLDLGLVVVVYNALTAGQVAGILTGALAGLFQDAMSGGVVGMAGLSNTIVGFAAGTIGTQFIVTHTFPRFVVFFLATIVNVGVFIGLYEVLGLRPFGFPIGQAAGQALGNAVVGVLAFNIIESLPGAIERRRAARTHVKR
jgi:rod shape-determining protein MreD